MKNLKASRSKNLLAGFFVFIGIVTFGIGHYVYAAGGLDITVERERYTDYLQGAEVDIRCVDGGIAGSWRNIGTTDENGNVNISGSTFNTRLGQSDADCGDGDTVDIMIYADGYVTKVATSTHTISGSRSTWANNTTHEFEFSEDNDNGIQYSHLVYVTDEEGYSLGYMDVYANDNECVRSFGEDGNYLCAVPELDGNDVDIDSEYEYDYYASSTVIAGRNAATDAQVSGTLVAFYIDRGCMDPAANNYDPSAEESDDCYYDAPDTYTGTTSALTGTSVTLGMGWYSIGSGNVEGYGIEYTTSDYYEDYFSYASTTEVDSVNIATPDDVTFDITGLSCGTEYRYQAFAYNEYERQNGNDNTFTTSACDPAAPIIVSATTTDIAHNEASFSIVIDPGNAEANSNIAEVGFQLAPFAYYNDNSNTFQNDYSLTGLDSSERVTQPLTTPDNLSCETEYIYRPFAVTVGELETYGDTQTFTTDACPPPEPHEFPGGDGSEETPYQIASCEDLEAVEEDMTAYYVLTGDINCSDVIIGDENNAFSGNFDGDDYYISNSIDTSSDYAGLFARLADASIRNLGVAGSYVSSGNNVGALAGYASSTSLQNVFAGEIEVEGNTNVGGLIGNAYDVIIEDSNYQGNVTGSMSVGGLIGLADRVLLYRVYSNGNVTGVDVVGGLAGYITDNDEPGYGIAESYSLADVTGEVTVGGLFGEAEYVSNIQDVYSNGSVEGYLNVGGIAGRITESILERAYSSGTITADGVYEGEENNSIGGIAGYVYNATINDSFSVGFIRFRLEDDGGGPVYDPYEVTSQYVGAIVGYYFIDDSEDADLAFSNNSFDLERVQKTDCVASSYDNGGSFSLDCTAVNTMEAQDEEYYIYNTSNAPLDVWDFETIWDTQVGEYPYLLMGDEDEDGDSEGDDEPYEYEVGDGSFEDPYEISSCADLRGIEDYVETLFELDTDLNCPDWEPIHSNVTDEGESVIGFFGNGHTINYTIDDSSTGNYGLFDTLSFAFIYDLNLTGSIEFEAVNAGGLAGVILEGSEVGRVHSSVDIEGEDGNIGGLAGYAVGLDVFDSYVSADLNGAGNTGGIIGYSAGSNEVNRTYSIGNISGQYVGGIVGNSSLDEGDDHSEYYDNFSDAIINEYDMGAYGAALVGVAREDDYFDNNWYGIDNTGYENCKNFDDEGLERITDIEGECNGTSGDEYYFQFNDENHPFENWDFDDVWMVTDAYPDLYMDSNDDEEEEEEDGLNDLLIDLIGYWELNEDITDLRIDSFGENDLADVNENVVGVDDGFIDQAAEFSAIDEYLMRVDNADLSTGSSTSFAVSLWVRMNETSGTQVFVSKFDSVNTGEYAIYAENGVFKFSTYTGGVGYAVDAYAGEVGEWYHIVAMHDAEEGTNFLTVNNGADNVIFSVPQHSDSVGNFVIGAFGATPSYSAKAEIDEVGFWKRTLTEQDIDDLYNDGDGLAFSSFGEEIEEPDVSIEAPASVDENYVEYLGFFSENGNTIVERGFEISIEEDMEGENTFLTETTEESFEGGVFSQAEEFFCGTYFYRAYVVDDEENYYYSNVLSFEIEAGCDEEEEEEDEDDEPRRGGGSGSRNRNSSSSSETGRTETTGSGNGSGFAFGRDLQTGASGIDVKELQKFLNTHGHPVAPAGPGSLNNETDLFGGLTRAALAQFQAANGLPATGFFGPMTRALIASMGGNVPTAPVAPVAPTEAVPTGVRDLELGMSGDDVKTLQSILIGKRFRIAAGATGYFGQQTKDALAAYQAANGLPANGFFGPQTRALMKSTNVPGLWW